MGGRYKTPESELFMQLNGKTFVKYPGLVAEAHARGLRSMDTEIVQLPTDANGREAIFKCVVYIDDPSDPRRAKRYTGHGDANPDNVNRMVEAHLIRMAETRAKARALRDAVNIGITSIEELGGYDDDDDDRAPAPPRQQERKPSPLAAARDALVAWVGPYRDERIEGGGGVSDLDFLAAVSRAEYGDEGANTLERIDALRKVIEAGGYAIETGKAK